MLGASRTAAAVPEPVLSEESRTLPPRTFRLRPISYATATWLLASSALQAQLGLNQPQAAPRADVGSAFLERQRALERENQRNLQETLPPAQKFRVDYGGWFNTYFFLFDDGFESSRTLRQYEMRLWASFSADQGIHEGYLRLRTAYDDWNHGDNFTNNHDDLDGPNLERGWYVFDVAKALNREERWSSPVELKIKAGRDLVHVGTGYAIDIPLDHAMLQGEIFGFETTYIGGRTPLSTENIDRNRAVADHSNRVFHILEERYKGFDSHELFAYIAWQDDHTKEDPVDLLQQYRYDSRYIGWGSVGELIPNLRYSTEWVIERGRSYNDQRFIKRSHIKAWGFDQRLDYYFKHKMKPVISAEWMFASGDPDRLGSPTNSKGGNQGDHVDNSFVGFGFRDTGLALAPRLSNIHVWRLGGSFRPFPDSKAAKDLELGTDWYMYYKNRHRAAISDPLADVQSGYAGWEMDYYANWRIWNDLAWTVRFGTFFPGKAFSDQTTRTFLLTGITWSF
ncbi:MAG TPA: alginate export family protein [Phycisphaerae bacterium]|nr:alginate export family protein [Phycisphaerae bacterium]